MANLGISQDPIVKVNGSPLAPAALTNLIDVRVEQALSMPTRFELRFLDPYFELLDGGTLPIGAALQVAFPLDLNETVEVVDGEIVSLGSEQLAGQRHEVVVAGYDQSHRLAHETRIRTFQKMTVKEVVAKVASENGLRSTVESGPGVNEQRPYVLQTSSDHEFLHELARRAGYEWRVTGTELRFERRVQAKSSVPPLKFGDDLRRFNARYSAAEHEKSVTVRAWNTQTSQALVGQFRGPAKPAVQIAGSTAPIAVDHRSKATFAGPTVAAGSVVESTVEADALAQALTERAAGAEFRVRGEAVGRPDLHAGAVVSISGVGTSLEGDYRLTSVEHVYGSGAPLRTKFTVAGVERSGLVDLLGGQRDALVPWGQTLGVTVGIVTNNKDPDGVGRVRLKFPALADSEESNWARVAGLGAGSKRGLVWMPSVNDEVLVAFEHGDLRRPYVIGSLWSGKQKPPSTAVNGFLEGQTVMQWMLQTQAGHQILVEDGQAPDKRRVTISLADGKTKLHVGEDKVELIANGKPLELSDGTAKFMMNGRGEIAISANKVTIDANQSVIVNGVQVELHAKAALKGDGATVEIKGSGMTSVQASGPLTLRGTPIQQN